MDKMIVLLTRYSLPSLVTMNPLTLTIPSLVFILWSTIPLKILFERVRTMFALQEKLSILFLFMEKSLTKRIATRVNEKTTKIKYRHFLIWLQAPENSRMCSYSCFLLLFYYIPATTHFSYFGMR